MKNVHYQNYWEWEKLTITRYMDGQLPSKKYSDYLYEILNDEQKMKSIVKKNHTIVSNKTIYKVK